MNLLSFSKLKNWEYWPPFMFYIPNIPYAAYLALKARNLVFFSATNPALKHPGNGSESKFDTLQLISKPHKPVSIFIRKNETIETTIYGGITGVILDGRGRPFNMPTDPTQRIADLTKWSAAVNEYPELKV